MWRLPAPILSWSRDPKLAHLCHVKTSNGIQCVQRWEWGVGHPVEVKSERDCKEPQKHSKVERELQDVKAQPR